IALYYSTDGGSSWIPIDEDEPDDDAYRWTIPNTPSTQCRVKVIAYDEADSTGEDTSDSDFTIEDCLAPTVDLTAPVGGESWCAGSSHDITWSASDDDSVTRIALYYSTDGGSAWIPIDEDESNDGLYPWIIPGTPSTQCRVKVTAYDEANNTGEDISDSNFTIQGCQSPTVSVLDPNGGEIWCIGSSYDILWSASDDVGVTNIALYYSTDGGSGWIPIDETETDDGVYTWIIPNTPSSQCRVKVKAYDEVDSTGEDMSDGNFTIRDCEPPTVDVLDPNGGENLGIGSSHDVLWSASDNLGVTKIVSLYYSTDGGSSWIPIDENEFNDGVFAWIIPDTPSAQCRVKVTAYDEAGNAGEDISNGDFTIGEADEVDDWTDNPNAPVNFALLQSHPNPFNPACKIPYALAVGCPVKLEIYNMLGQKVRILLEEYQTAGRKTVHWDGTDDQGKSMPAGLYFYRIRAGEFVDSKKMVLLR
ncbi:MAG: Ig-like domain-containing protein, partial [Candidatus Zixiibacteriota bacterium]